ncbi:MAG TPA: hypothetical protein VFQ43_13540 [Nitrososphaera sp.]|nr:hypothetical protein [Nitrososphaera sp.]
MNAICPNCGVIERTVAQQIGGKISFGLAGAAFGKQAVKKNPLLGIACVVGGLMVGHYIDHEVGKLCPQCGAILRITGLLP